MVAIYYQLSIILSIGLAGLLGSYIISSSRPFIYKALPNSVVALGWTIETLLLLRIGSKLSNTQLTIIWTTYVIVLIVQFVIYTKNKKINTLEYELKSALKESGFKATEQINIGKYTDESKLEKIDGINHYEFLLSSIEEAKHSIYILSGWLSNSVIDNTFITLLNNALKRGVNVYIGYGWQDFKGVHKDNYQALENLRGIYRNKMKFNYSGDILVSKFPNHQKILIIDDKYIVVGSANWLSNKTYKNEEFSFAIYSKKLSNEESHRIKKIIQKYLGKTKTLVHPANAYMGC